MHITAVDIPLSDAHTNPDYWNDPEEYAHGLSLSYARMELLGSIGQGRVTLNKLRAAGLKGNLQGPMHVDGAVLELILRAFLNDAESVAPDVKFKEGAPVKELVNRYQRNMRARTVCRQKKGYRCSICGFDFEKAYGAVGHGLIQVHHDKPISTFDGGHDIDPNDLYPICPNCHFMIHHMPGGEYISVADFRKLYFNHIRK